MKVESSVLTDELVPLESPGVRPSGWVVLLRTALHYVGVGLGRHGLLDLINHQLQSLQVLPVVEVRGAVAAVNLDPR